MEEHFTHSADGQSESGKQTQPPLVRRGCSERVNRWVISGATEPGTSRAAIRFVVDGQHRTETGTATDAIGRRTLAETGNCPSSTFDAVKHLQRESSHAGNGVQEDFYPPAIENWSKECSAALSSGAPALASSPGSASPLNLKLYRRPSRDYICWVPTTNRLTQLVPHRIIHERQVSLQSRNALRRVPSLPKQRTAESGGVTAIPSEATQKSTEVSKSVPGCKQKLIHRVNLRRRLAVCQDKWVKADSSDGSSVQLVLPDVCSPDSLHDGQWHYERRYTPSNRDSGSLCMREFEIAPKLPAGTAAVNNYLLGLGASVDAVSCPLGAVSAPTDNGLQLQRQRPHDRSTSDSDSIAGEEQAAEACRPMARSFSRSPQLERLTQRKKRSTSQSPGQSPSVNDPPSAEGSGRAISRVASLAFVARSCMQRRVSPGTGNDPPLLTSRNSRSVHHVFFRASSAKRQSFPKPPTENGSATEASENGRTASSRTSSSGTVPQKCTPYTVGKHGYRECDSFKDVTLADLEKNQLDTSRPLALGEASATVSGTPQIDSHDRRLLHRVDPAKLLRVSCSKCFSDDQTRQTRFADVNRPIVCEERFSSRYFRKKGEASGAPGNWPADDPGSTIISRKLACMLVREVQREVRYGFYPICTRAAMMWVSLLGSILFLSMGAWLTVEDERHIECRLNYEDETLQEGGSRYSLLSITSDLCSGRLHIFRLNTSRPDEKTSGYESGKSWPHRGSSSEEYETSREPGGSSNSRRSHRNSVNSVHAPKGSQLDGPSLNDPRSAGTRKKVPRRRAIGFSGSSSAPLSYFFTLPASAPQELPPTKENGSVISELTGPYIYVYIEMERFYQSDAQVVWSRKDEQLAGKVFTDPKDLKECEPAVTAVVDNVTKVLHPCGVLAWNVFTDRFQFLDAVPDDATDTGPVRPLVLEQSREVLLNSLGDWRKSFKNPPADVRARYRDRVYFWMSLSDNDDGKDMYKTLEEAKAELLMDRLNYEEAGEMVENGHFIQWMHTAPFGTWRKFYGRIRGPVKLPLFAYIAVTYDVKQWRGKKAIVLVQPSKFGGRTQFLGSAYLVFGCILAIVATYMIWRKWFYVTEDDDVECTRDLRWRTQRKRRGKKR